jgi:hypothetical protein
MLRPAAPSVHPGTTATTPYHYDPSLTNKPLRHARPRWQRPLSVLILLVVVGAFAAGGYALWSVAERRSTELTLPVVTSSPNFRSATITALASGTADSDANFVATVDTVDLTIDTKLNDGTGSELLSDQTQLFLLESGQWTRGPIPEGYLEEMGALFEFARGLTVDDVFPAVLRPHVRVVGVEAVQLGPLSMRRFDMVVDEPAIMSGRQEEIDAFDEFWGEREPGEAAATPFNASLWVDDNGLVHKVQSVSDIDQSRFEMTLDYSDAPFVPVFPTVFTDVPT